MNRLRWTSAIPLLLCLLVGVTGGAAAAATAPEPGPIDVDIVQVSTPDSAFGLGRTMRPAFVFADLRLAEFDVAEGRWMTRDTGQPIIAMAAMQTSAFSDTTGQNLGPGWVSYIDPSALELGAHDIVPNAAEFSLVLTNNTGASEPMAGRCPDLSGTYTVDEVSVDGDGMPLSLALSYVVTCGSSDTTWGSMAYNAELPALPAEASATADIDLAFPHPSGDWGPGIETDLLGADIEGDSLHTAWGQGDGFSCAAVKLVPRGEGPSLEHVGNDDTHTFVGLDTNTSFDLGVALDWQSVWSGTLDCGSSDGSSNIDELSVLGATVVVQGSSAPISAETAVTGSVSAPSTTADSHEPVPGAIVELWRSVDGLPTLLRQTTTDAAGAFNFVVPNWNTKRVWVELPERDPTVSSPVGWFAQTSDAVTLTSEHVVTARVSRTEVPSDSSVTVRARLNPRGESSPLQLQRRNHQGAWVTVDEVAAIPEATTALSLPRARQGWQALRVVAPADDRHGAGISETVRIYGR